MKTLLTIMACTVTHVKAKLTSQLKQVKKANKELALLKRQLATRQPTKPASLYNQYPHREIYQRINTDMEAFFFKREYTIDNFNFLLNLLAEQQKADTIPSVIKKMLNLGILPDERSYNYMIKAAAMVEDTALAEIYFEQACKQFLPNKYFYTSLMQAYVKTRNPTMAFKILQEMEECDITPDLPVYTTLINCFRQGRCLDKCWEVNRRLIRKKVPLDETYVGVMLKVHAATHDAEKAIKLYKQQIASKGVKPMIETTNSYFKALATRPEYSQRVIDLFLDMAEQGELINEETVRWALKACSTLAHISSAIEIVKYMRLKGIEPSKFIYNSLLRVYGNAMKVPLLHEHYKQVILVDCWKLMEEVAERGMVDITIVNNMLYLHAMAFEEARIDGLVLPLYDKYNLEYNVYTYEVLVQLYYKKGDFNTVMRLWQQMKAKLAEKERNYVVTHGQHQTTLDAMKEELRPSFKLLETYLQMGIRLMDMNMVLEALDMFKKLKRHPKNSTLKFLGNLKDLPVEIQTSLMDFQIRFGAAKIAKTRTHSEKEVQDPQNRL